VGKSVGSAVAFAVGPAVGAAVRAAHSVKDTEPSGQIWKLESW
jgi:hypothetical protein